MFQEYSVNSYKEDLSISANQCNGIDQEDVKDIPDIKPAVSYFEHAGRHKGTYKSCIHNNADSKVSTSVKVKSVTLFTLEYQLFNFYIV